jgi:predicted aspartyl protease
MLVNFDIDLDFGSNTLNYFSQDHCDGKVQWQGSDIAAIPFTIQSGHITIPVMIDGQMMNAIIDTGCANTTVNLDTAGRVFNLTPQSAGMTSLGHMPGNMFANVYKHSFGNLSFAGVSIKSPSVTLMPDMSHGSLPDVIIGMDVLRHLHLYVAFGQKMIYVSKADSTGIFTARNRQSGLVTIAMN